MAKPWSQVESSKEYLSLSPASKVKAKKDYFDSVVKQKPEFMSLSPEQQSEASIEFFGGRTADNPEKKRSLGEYVLPTAISGYEPKPGERTLLGDIFERPGAAIRSAIQGEGYTKGAAFPENVPRFQDIALDKYYESDILKDNPMMKTYLGGSVSALGMAGDVATQPAEVLGGVLGASSAMTPSGRAISQSIGSTKPARALAEIGNIDVGKAAKDIAGRPVEFVKGVARNIKNVRNPVKFAKNVRTELFKKKKAVGDAFEQGIKDLSKANPDKQVDLSPQFAYLRSAMDNPVENPGLASDVRGVVRRIKDPEKVKLITKLIEEPESAKNLTLSQAQDIKVAIKQSPSIAAKLKQGKFADFKPGDLELLDLVDEIKVAQSDVFPELADINKAYGDYISNYREVKNYFKPKSLIDRMRNGFGNEEIESMINVVVPENTVKQIRGFGKASRAIKGGKTLAKYGLGFEAGRRFFINPVLNNINE